MRRAARPTGLLVAAVALLALCPLHDALAAPFGVTVDPAAAGVSVRLVAAADPMEVAVSRVAQSAGSSVVTVQSLVRRPLFSKSLEGLLRIKDLQDKGELPLETPTDPTSALPDGDRSAWMLTVGTGFVVDREGWVLTCAALVEQGARTEVVGSDGRSIAVQAIYYDRITQVAALRVDPTELDARPLNIRNAQEPRLGRWVVQVGPGASPDSDPFVSLGIVGGLALPVSPSAIGGAAPVRNALWVNAVSIPDGAGAPVVALDGTFVGLSLPGKDALTPMPGLGVVPASLVLPVFDQLRAGGAVRRAWLGVGLLDVPVEVSADRGAYLSFVREDGPAAAAGLKPGDVIVGCTPVAAGAERKVIRSGSDLVAAIEWLEPGSQVEFEAVRGPERLTVRVELGLFPDESIAEAPPSEPTELLGATYRGATEEERAALGVASGVVLESVAAGGFCSAMGLEPGDVLVQANGVPITDNAALDAVLSAVGSGGQLLLDVRRKDKDGRIVAYLVGARL